MKTRGLHIIEPFWDDNHPIVNEYYSPMLLNDETIQTVEKKLGYRLPSSYINFMKLHNGGIPHKNNFRLVNQEKKVIHGFFPIGTVMENALCGDMGSRFMIEQWGYPNCGVYICDTPSAGHDMIALDYTNNGIDGEPEVVHIDQGANYQKTLLAKDFNSFIKGLSKP